MHWWHCSIYFLLGDEIEHYHCYGLSFGHGNHCNLIFSSLKLENGLKKHVWNVARIKYEFVELVVILFIFMQNVIMLFLLILPEKDSHCTWWKLSLLISDVLICSKWPLNLTQSLYFLPLIRRFSYERRYRKIFKNYCFQKKKWLCTKENFQYNTRIISTKLFQLSSSVQFLYK